MIRYLADADLNDAIVSGCRRREPAMDFLSAIDANLEGVADPEVLALAAAENRILVSHDFQTMPRHFGDFLQAYGSSPGLILVPHTSRLEKRSRSCYSSGVLQKPRSGKIDGVRCLSRKSCVESPTYDGRWWCGLDNYATL